MRETNWKAEWTLGDTGNPLPDNRIEGSESE